MDVDLITGMLQSAHFNQRAAIPIEREGRMTGAIEVLNKQVDLFLIVQGIPQAGVTFIDVACPIVSNSIPTLK
jgi:hypothetical protein